MRKEGALSKAVQRLPHHVEHQSPTGEERKRRIKSRADMSNPIKLEEGLHLSPLLRKPKAEQVDIARRGQQPPPEPTRLPRWQGPKQEGPGRQHIQASKREPPAMKATACKQEHSRRRRPCDESFQFVPRMNST